MTPVAPLSKQPGDRGVIGRWDPDEAIETVCQPCGRDLDVICGETAVLDVDPETVEVTGHPEVADQVGMEHPPDGKHHQSFPSWDGVSSARAWFSSGSVECRM